MPTLPSPGVLVLHRGGVKEEWMKLKATVNMPLRTAYPERAGIFTTTITMAISMFIISSTIYLTKKLTGIVTTITDINLTTNWA